MKRTIVSLLFLALGSYMAWGQSGILEDVYKRQAISDIVVNRHGKRAGALRNQSHFPAEWSNIRAATDDILSVYQNFPFDTNAFYIVNQTIKSLQ